MDRLQYPFAEPPESGGLLEVAPGVLWLRMPLPLALDHINLYLVRDDAGWYVIDTGIGLEETQTLWRKVIEEKLDGLPIVGVICTHMHPDHIGQAGWLCDEFRAPLYMSRAEYFGGRTLTSMPSGLSWTAEQYMFRVGSTDERIERARNSDMSMASIVNPMPMAYERLRAGDELQIGGNSWRVIVGEGHSPEHVSLYCDALKVLLSGDQIIPRITPNISVMPMEPEANPLGDWLRDLPQFLNLPEDTLVLPAHNTPFYGLHLRVNRLMQHHEDHMVVLEQQCVEPKTAVELLPALFKRALDDSQLGMAIGECVAHLNLLLQRGRMRRTLSDEGRWLYQTIDEQLDQRKVSADYADDEDDATFMV
jgi:glyoxylase-like metal-dependent hydrolase (beta-lactamase superfamily II)